MKTFDISLKYLKEIDFSLTETYDPAPVPLPDDPLRDKKIEEQIDKYRSDPDNTASNEYYRNMVLAACMYHLIDLAHKRPSYFNVACEIIEYEISILDNKQYELYERTNYPKVMVDKFIKYCDEMNPQPKFLSATSEVRLEFFMVAYHYIVGEDTKPEGNNFASTLIAAEAIPNPAIKGESMIRFQFSCNQCGDVKNIDVHDQHEAADFYLQIQSGNPPKEVFCNKCNKI